MADYITTYTKVHFTPLEPKAEELRVEDIAHALSLMCRANGHFPEFYSVAQHCLHCCEEAQARGYSERVVKACLLHDAGEAYLADITRPVKKNLPDYRTIEDRLLETIYTHFLGDSLTDEEAAQVKDVDDSLLYHEFYHYMGEKLQSTSPCLSSHPVFETRSFCEVEKEYLDTWRSFNV
jgi:hypothetical protein